MEARKQRERERAQKNTTENQVGATVERRGAEVNISAVEEPCRAD